MAGRPADRDIARNKFLSDGQKPVLRRTYTEKDTYISDLLSNLCLVQKADL